MMESGDRPGRYYSENPIGIYNPQRIRSTERGITAGGHWYGVKSMRTMLPWIRDTKFTPSQLRDTLKRRGRFYWRDKVLLSAAAFVRNEKRKT